MFFITAWMARYLGPEGYGQLVYSIAIAEIVMLFWTQGLKEVIIHQTNKLNNNSSGVILASFQLMLVGNTILYGILVLLTLLFNSVLLTKYLILVCGIGIWFRCFESFELWFHANLKIRVTVLIQFFSQLVYMTLNVLFIVFEVDVFWFGFSYMLQLIISGVGFLIVYLSYKPKTVVKRIKLSTIQKKILKLGLLMVLAKFTLTSSFLVDRILIDEILGIESVGIYSASLKLITTFLFVSSAFSLSYIPMLSEKKEFDKVSSDMFGWISTFSMLLMSIFLVFSDELVFLIYGDQYSESIEILKTLVFCTPILFANEAIKSWIVIKDLTVYYIFSMLLITILNILFNYNLILSFGLVGAALAFNLSWFLGGFMFFFLFNKTQPLAFSILRSFIFPITLFNKFFSSKD